MIGQVILEGVGLGAVLMLVCAIGIRNGALGLTTREKIKHNQFLFKVVCLPIYIAYVLIFVYAVNGARGFWEGFWQMLVILFVLNLIDRLLIDDFWVGHTKMWIIPGTEDLKPYIPNDVKRKKWLFGTLGMAVIAAVLAGVTTLFIH